MPTPMPMTALRANANPSTAVSTRIASSRGRPAGLSATRARTPNSATASPSAPPTTASSRLSVRSWRTSRARPAPSAARIANSPLALRAAGEQQIGHVDAGDREQQEDRGDDGEQRRPHGLRHLVAQRAQQHPRAEVGPRDARQLGQRASRAMAASSRAAASRSIPGRSRPTMRR